MQDVATLIILQCGLGDFLRRGTDKKGSCKEAALYRRDKTAQMSISSKPRVASMQGHPVTIKKD